MQQRAHAHLRERRFLPQKACPQAVSMAYRTGSRQIGHVGRVFSSRFGPPWLGQSGVSGCPVRKHHNATSAETGWCCPPPASPPQSISPLAAPWRTGALPPPLADPCCRRSCRWATPPSEEAAQTRVTMIINADMTMITSASFSIPSTSRAASTAFDDETFIIIWATLTHSRLDRRVTVVCETSFTLMQHCD